MSKPRSAVCSVTHRQTQMSRESVMQVFYILTSVHKHLSVLCTNILIGKLIMNASYLVPGHWFRPEERAGEFYREAFLVVLGFVL